MKLETLETPKNFNNEKITNNMLTNSNIRYDNKCTTAAPHR